MLHVFNSAHFFQEVSIIFCLPFILLSVLIVACTNASIDTLTLLWFQPRTVSCFIVAVLMWLLYHTRAACSDTPSLG